MAAAAVAITLPMPLWQIRDNSRYRSNASLLTRSLPASLFGDVMFGDVPDSSMGAGALTRLLT
jgi:hypothetical protein